LLSVSRIHDELHRRGQVWPAPIHHLEEAASTNDWLKERARDGLPDWTTVVADEQTSGRGRHGRTWYSQPGDLMMSVLVRPPAGSSWLTLLPLASGLAVVEAAAAFGAEASLKWPNDVVIEEPRGDGAAYRKLAGILVEGVNEGILQAVVVGVGVNVVPVAGTEPGAAATALRTVTRKAVSRDALAATVLARLAVWYDALARGEADAVVAAWTARALPWWGRTVEVRSGEIVLCGIARGVDSRGALLLETGPGEMTPVLSGLARQVRAR
jgi:BirA family transcriptional regulator, biotin operon repressor / biotin---[acetyl-CoA-carboxylase] ligase